MREGRGWGSGGLRPALPQVQASAHLPFPATAISARRLRDGAEVDSTPQHLPGILSSLFLPRVLWSASATLRLSVEPRPAPLPPSPGQRLAFGGGLVYALRDASRLGGLFALTCFRHSGQTRPLCSPQRTPWSSAHPQPALARTISVPQEQGRANL